MKDQQLKKNFTYHKCIECLEDIDDNVRLCRLDCSKHLLHAQCFAQILADKKIVGDKIVCRICKEKRRRNNGAQEDILDSEPSEMQASPEGRGSKKLYGSPSHAEGVSLNDPSMGEYIMDPDEEQGPKNNISIKGINIQMDN
jgi:hypothetical protein